MSNCIRISLSALPWGACPRCRRPPDRFFWVGTWEPPSSLLAGMGLVRTRSTIYRNWQACSACKICDCVGAGLLTPPDDLDEAAQLLELSAYTEVEFTLDVGPPYQLYCGGCIDGRPHSPV